MRIINVIRYSLVAFAVAALLGGCGEDEPETGSEAPEAGPDTSSALYMKLADTTWKLISSQTPSTDYLAVNPQYRGETITFSSEPYQGWSRLYCSAFNGYLSWSVVDDQTNTISISNMGTMDSFDVGRMSVFGTGEKYVSFSGTRMTLSSVEYSSVQIYEQVSGGGSGNTGGDSQNETPDVDFYDYTQIGSSKVKVDFIIYNKDEAGVTSATIKYGTTSAASSSVTTSLSGKHATATINGLSANRDYYVKCQVKTRNGSYTTEATRIRLSEW